VAKELVYLALGDSTGVGVGARSGGGYPERILARLRPTHPTLRLVNLSRSGATTADLIEGQLPRAARVRPRVITIGIGINDLGLQVPDDAFALNLEEIATGVGRLGAAVVIANLPDLALSPAVQRIVPRALYERRIEMFNLHVTATAARHRMTCVDLFTWSRELPRHPEYFSPDGFHPSDRGYEVWAERMLPAMEGALREPAHVPA
jgi:lysophospholipase L1-like esterase